MCPYLLSLKVGSLRYDYHVDDHSASPRRPFRTRFAAAALARGTWPIFENGTRGVRKGREVAVW